MARGPAADSFIPATAADILQMSGDMGMDSVPSYLPEGSGSVGTDGSYHPCRRHITSHDCSLRGGSGHHGAG